VVFADPASDLAVLGPWDDQEPLGFDEWYETVTPLSIAEPFGGTHVHILTHLGEWMHGEIIETGALEDEGTFPILTDREIPSGTSGGSVVDDDGRVVGVVSVSTPQPYGREGKYAYGGCCPAVSFALPQWLLRRIREAEEA
jgi:S1-C subfamily serine protease